MNVYFFHREQQINKLSYKHPIIKPLAETVKHTYHVIIDKVFPSIDWKNNCYTMRLFWSNFLSCSIGTFQFWTIEQQYVPEQWLAKSVLRKPQNLIWLFHQSYLPLKCVMMIENVHWISLFLFSNYRTDIISYSKTFNLENLASGNSSLSWFKCHIDFCYLKLNTFFSWS